MKNKYNWKDYIGIFLLLSLIVSIIYSIVKIFTAPLEIDTTDLEYYELVKADYLLMLLQCILGLIIMKIPSFIEKRRRVDIPDFLEIMYFVFLFLAIVLGEVRNFYYVVPHWDTILHSFSGFMLAILGFYLVNLLNNSEKTHIHLTPFFVSLFSFCFALAIGAIREIYEFIMDSVLSLNMQRYMLQNGTKLVGHEALIDTMKDIIVDAGSALIISLMGYFSIKKRKKLPGFKFDIENISEEC